MGFLVQQRERLLEEIASAIERHADRIRAANNEDMLKAKESKTDDNLIQRLGLKPEKLRNVCKGIRSIAKQDEPIGKVACPYIPVLWHMYPP